MTDKELKQTYYIRQEIELYERKLRELRSMSMTGSRTDGMPRGSSRGDRVADFAVKIADTERKLNDLQLKLISAEAEIMDFITGIDDSFIRQIIYCRMILRYSWTRTAHKIGGGNTADSCRMAYKRYMRGTNDDGRDTATPV